jgi:hypothetical protein
MRRLEEWARPQRTRLVDVNVSSHRRQVELISDDKIGTWSANPQRGVTSASAKEDAYDAVWWWTEAKSIINSDEVSERGGSGSFLVGGQVRLVSTRSE